MTSARHALQQHMSTEIADLRLGCSRLTAICSQNAAVALARHKSTSLADLSVVRMLPCFLTVETQGRQRDRHKDRAPENSARLHRAPLFPPQRPLSHPMSHAGRGLLHQSKAFAIHTCARQKKASFPSTKMTMYWRNCCACAKVPGPAAASNVTWELQSGRCNTRRADTSNKVDCTFQIYTR